MKKTLVISDLHLNKWFDKELYHYIVNLVESVDQVIINGDFWDYYLNSFDEFIASDWNQLFPLLKEKKAVYIFGNHDREKFADERMSFFSVKQVDEYTLRSGDKTFVIEHGHRIAPEMDEKHPFLTRMFDSLYPRFYFYMMKDLWVTRLIHRKVIDPSKDRLEASFHKFVSSQDLPKNQAYIFGHSHIFDEPLSKKYYNSGYFFGGVAHYLIIQDGTVTPHVENYW